MNTESPYAWMRHAAAAWYRDELAKATKPRIRLLSSPARSDVARASQADVISGHTAKKPCLTLVRIQFSKKDD